MVGAYPHGIVTKVLSVVQGMDNQCSRGSMSCIDSCYCKEVILILISMHTKTKKKERLTFSLNRKCNDDNKLPHVHVNIFTCSTEVDFNIVSQLFFNFKGNIYLIL